MADPTPLPGSDSPRPLAAAPPPAGGAQSRPDIGSLLSRLARLKTRIRTLLVALAASRIVAATATVLVLFFFADWLLDLPLGVRRFVRLGLLDAHAGLSFAAWLPLLLTSAFLAVALTRSRRPAAGFFSFATAGVVGLLAWVSVRALAPLTLSFLPQDLALGVESRFRQLRDRLAGALDFDRELRAPSRGESVAMMEAVVREAVHEAGSISFTRAASSRRAVEWVGAAAGTLLVCTLVAVLLPSQVSLWARRSLLLETVQWPRRTTVVAVELAKDVETLRDPTQPYAVALGRALTVYARAQGKVPDEAWLIDLIKDQQPLPRRMYAVPQREGLFAFEFRDVRRPFAFALKGGDDDDEEPIYRVEITIPPAVVRIQASVHYPDYLGLAPRQLDGGNVTVPEGAQVTMTFDVNEQILEAQVALGESTIAASEVAGSQGRSFSFAFEARESLHYRLLLRTPDGKTNDAAADTFEIRVQPDQVPTLEWSYPRTSLERTVQGRVPLLFAARDDYGVSELVLELRVGAATPTRHILSPHVQGAERGDDGILLQCLDGPLGRTEVLGYLALDVSALRGPDGQAPAEDTQVAIRAVARDARSQLRESEWTPVDVRAAPVLERSLADRRGDVRTALEGVRREQRQRRTELADLTREASLGRAEIDLLKTIRYAQGKIAQDLDRAVRELLDVFNGFVFNRVTAQAPTAHVLSIIDRSQRRSYGRVPEGAAASGEAWLGDPVFPYALYDELVDAWRQKIIYDTMVLDRMLSVLADGVPLAARLAPAAQEAAVPATTGDGDAMRALLNHQDQLLLSLDRLLDAMQGWQNLHDLTMTLRMIIDSQKALYPEPAAGGDARSPR